jgi:hypothetical protein
MGTEEVPAYDKEALDRTRSEYRKHTSLQSSKIARRPRLRKARWRRWRAQRAHKRSKCNASPELRFCATVGRDPEIEVALV